MTAILDLAAELDSVWSRDTSADPDGWTPENPSYGHCAVVALVVQAIAGGVLLRTTVDGVSHYFNRLPDGTEVDLTREQFTEWTPTEVTERSREYVLSFAPTAARYELLAQRLAEAP